MFKSFPFASRGGQTRAWMIGLICAMTLIVSACGNLPSNSQTPTPTTLMGFISPPDQSTEVPTAGNPATGKTLDVCGLATKADAGAVLGQAVTAVTPGTDSENDFGGTLYFCTYLGTGLAVVISEVDLGSAGAASQTMKLELAKMQSDDASTTTTATQIVTIFDNVFRYRAITVVGKIIPKAIG